MGSPTLPGARAWPRRLQGAEGSAGLGARGVEWKMCPGQNDFDVWETGMTVAIHGLAKSPGPEGPGEAYAEAWPWPGKKRRRSYKQGGDMVTTLPPSQPVGCSQTPRPSPGLVFLPRRPSLLPSSPTPTFWFQPAFTVPFQCRLSFGDFLEPWRRNVLFLPSSP